MAAGAKIFFQILAPASHREPDGSTVKYTHRLTSQFIKVILTITVASAKEVPYWIIYRFSPFACMNSLRCDYFCFYFFGLASLPANMPPSMVSSIPVTYLLSSLAKYKAP